MSKELRGRLRLRFDDAVEAAVRPPLCDTLVNSGCELSEDANLPVLVVFRTPSEAVTRAIRAETESGLERILAVTLEPRGLLPLEQFALLSCGAGDVLSWDEAGQCAERILARVRRWQAVDDLLESETVRQSLMGESACFRRVLRQVVEIAAFSDAPLLILGETGTGKELVARLVHALDPRPDKGDFVVLDC